jgi:hypothetical protein
VVGVCAATDCAWGETEGVICESGVTDVGVETGVLLLLVTPRGATIPAVGLVLSDTAELGVVDCVVPEVEAADEV